ncbi:AMP-binding protein [Actinomadura sp. 7K534]|uniref:AMP-binding protein n=1 Tax=Actinomadura sp. 7K534 TaxID=2530366 RepID=UPI001044AA9F|nr:AMP-binding protein [Actinomadura sp. 7K534]TDB95463.1 ATP-dependent acyl-CoA ligase [Actinomadura sp. 7K534]
MAERRTVPLHERVLPDLLLGRAEEAPDAPLLTVGAGPRRSTGEIADAALRVGGGLARLGVARGDPVAVMLPNREEAVLAWFGTAVLGAVEVPVNTNLSGPLLHHVLSDCRATVLIVAADLLPVVRPLLPTLPLKTIVVVGGTEPGREPGHGHVAWDEVAGADPVAPAKLTPADPIAVMYTSGTTGPAKGVVCPHGYFMCWADDTGRAVRFGPGDVLYTPLPLYHITAQAVNVQLALVHRGQAIVDTRFSPRGFWRRMAELGATHVWSFGSMTPLLHQRPPDEHDRAHRVRVVWSIPWPAGFGREFEDRFGVRILCGYGSTEQGLTVVQPYDAVEPGAIGLPSPHYEVAVVDGHGAQADEGELVVRPREPASMMSGYLGRDRETMAVTRDLWYHTGDLVQRRPDGYLAFVERKTDSIRRRGENISAWEIESTAATFPGVVEAAAIGVPSPLGEHDVMLVATTSEPVEPRELFDFCVERLPYYMVPRYIRFAAELPKTPSMRVQKYRLRELGVTADSWDCEAAGLRPRRPNSS